MALFLFVTLLDVDWLFFDIPASPLSVFVQSYNIIII